MRLPPLVKRLVLALALLCAVPALATAATVAVATSNVNLRAGPSTAYPAVIVVPAGASITTYGCLADYSWCDISLGSARGWVAARYIQVVYRGAPVVLSPVVAPAIGLTVVAFNKVYWDTHYAAYPWYGTWNRYPAYRPGPVTSVNRAVGCANGHCTTARSATGVYGGSAAQVRTCGGGQCGSVRQVTGPQGQSATRVRTCSRYDQSCAVSRTGPRGASSTRTFER